jgi:hypothetical protein
VPVVFVPAILRSLIPMTRVEVMGATVGEIINELEARFPGVATLLVSEDDVAPASRFRSTTR